MMSQMNGLKKAKPNSHRIADVKQFTQDGVTYTVDGDRVRLEYSKHEKEIAELLEKTLGGDIRMMPQVKRPIKIRTPDYLFNGQRCDLKTMKRSTSENAVYNRIHDSLDQADNFVLDISNNPLGQKERLRLTQELYFSKYLRSVKNIIIVENMKNIKINTRKLKQPYGYPKQGAPIELHANRFIYILLNILKMSRVFF